MSRLLASTPGAAQPRKPKVLFVCVGNAVRSQMAEAFAKVYGKDVMEPVSGGMSPASSLMPLTRKVMSQRGIDVSLHYPKSIFDAPGGPFDVIVNISGMPLPRQFQPRLYREWDVRDPVLDPEPEYERVATQIESLVMQLVLELRRGSD